MFTPNPNGRRVIIVDVSHICMALAFSNHKLSHSVYLEGVGSITYDTTIMNGVIKNIYHWSNKGSNPIVVCFDSSGCNRARKYYFTNQAKKYGVEESVEYKSKRGTQSNSYFEEVNRTRDLLVNSGVTVYESHSYEADDLVFGAVQQAKLQYPDLPIDVVTSDLDLAPLVDEQVSVFIRSPKLDYATDESIAKKHYQQLTPKTYQRFLEGRSSLKGLKVPYNTILLSKLLRGDKSDAVPAFKKFTPTKYNNLIDNLIADGVDVANLFRYDRPTEIFMYRGTQNIVPVEAYPTLTNDDIDIYYGDSKKLTEITTVLSKYLDEPIIEHIKFVYNGIALGTSFTDAPLEYTRKPTYIPTVGNGFNPAKMMEEASKFGITLRY